MIVISRILRSDLFEISYYRYDIIQLLELIRSYDKVFRKGK